MEKPLILAVLVVFVITFFEIPICDAESNLTQKFTLHADEGCQDEGESYTENIRNLRRVSAIVRTNTLKCACADFGVWSYSERKNYYGGIFGGSNLAVTRLESNKVCITPDHDQIRSIRKVGNSDVEQPALSLYTDFSLRGRELYMDGTYLRLPWPILFRSLGFTGVNTSWSLFSDIEAEGDAVCLGQDTSTLITFTSGTKLTLVGSITRSGEGCAASASGNKKRAVKSSPTPPVPEPSVISAPAPSLTLTLRDRAKEISTDASELRLPYPITVYSFTFDGPSNWTLFRGILLNGRPKCLVYGSGDTGPQTFTDDIDGFPIAGVIVGSIRRGCNFSSDKAAGDEDYPFEDEDIYDYDDEVEVNSANRIVSVFAVFIGGLFLYSF